MPRARKENCTAVIQKKENSAEEFDIRSNDSSPLISKPDIDDADESCVANKPSRKKRLAENEYDPGEFSHEMHKMLEGFGADISKTLFQKKKRMEELTQASLKNANKKVEKTCQNQLLARTKLQTEFSKQVNAVYQQWELDIEKTREQEEKLNTLFKQQQKCFQQSRIVQNQRLKTIKELSEQFIKGLEDLEQVRESQQALLQSELKKEMQLLQKRMLMETQQKEMENVRKSLHSMLY